MSKTLTTPRTRLSTIRCRYVRRAGEGQRGHGERLQHHQGLGDEQQAVAVPAVHEDAGEGGQDQARHWPQKPTRPSQKEDARRAGQLEDEPGHGHLLHPGADERDALAEEEQAEVAVRQGAPERSQFHDRPSRRRPRRHGSLVASGGPGASQRNSPQKTGGSWHAIARS